jgi:hypothetical protein
LEYVSPICDGHTPFFFDVHYSQVNGFLGRPVVCKLNFGFGILSDSPVEVFDGIGCVNDFSDLQREVKITGQFSVPAPVYHIPVFGPILSAFQEFSPAACLPLRKRFKSAQKAYVFPGHKLARLRI